jgi:hypothetical protein
MATYEIEITRGIMMVDAETEEEAIEECESILNNILFSWDNVEVV